MLCHKTIRISCLLAGTAIFTMTAFAQEGRVEIAGFGGEQRITGAGFNPYVGGSGGVRVTEHLRVFGEVGYSPLSSLANQAAGEATALTGVPVSATVRLFNFGGGIDYSFGSSDRFVPYVLAAVGVGHTSVSASASVDGVSASATDGMNSAYLGVGGGVRIYAGHNWGFKPEFCFQRYGGTLASNSMVISGGVFLQFGH